MLPPPDIIIVTQKSELEISPMRVCVEGYCMDCNVIVTCREGKSVAENRNYGLEQAKSPIVIMLDELVQGFYRGWWRELINPMEQPNIVLLSARLLGPDGVLINMPYSDNLLKENTEYVPVVPFNCCAIRNDGSRFDEAAAENMDYVFMEKLLASKQNSIIAINNTCKMIYSKKIIIQMAQAPGWRKPKETVVT